MVKNNNNISNNTSTILSNNHSNNTNTIKKPPTPLMFPYNSSSCTVGLRGTVISQVWWKVILVIIYTSLICLLDVFVPMDFTPALVPILGTVIGFLLVFRTNTAYDRYYEGRKVWSGMTQAVRRLICCVWISVNDHDSKMIVEKKQMVNCIVAFPIAVKHYLREEYSYDYDDLKSLIGNLAPFKNKLHASAIQPKKNVRRATRKFSFLTSGVQDVPPSNIPLEIIHCIGIYIKSLISRKLVDNSVLVSMNLALTCLIDDLGSFERILRTPLPLAYSVHLHHALWIHLLSLPFQLVSTLGWWTIPAVGFTSFALLGILEIGWEIENPFGYDDNDLPLDDFCDSLQREVKAIIQNKLRRFEDLFSPETSCVPYEQLNNTLYPPCPNSFAELSVSSLEEVAIVPSNNRVYNCNSNNKPNGFAVDTKF